MISYGIIGSLLIVCIVLYIKLKQKQTLHIQQKEVLDKQIHELEDKSCVLKDDIEYQTYHLNEIKLDLAAAKQAYTDALEKTDELNNLLQSQQDAMEDAIAHKQALLDLQYENTKRSYLEKSKKDQEDLELLEQQCITRKRELEIEMTNQQVRFDSLLTPLRQYEMEKQERLFYTIQVPDEYKDDIDFLLTTVSQKVNHPDIINKLVWAEYVKPYMDDMIKRVDIKEQPGIYKITHLDSGKCYIGKSTNVKKRLQDHMKSTIGIKSIADQAVHHAMLDSGFWNWTFEVIIYCDKEQLNDLEKYYISFFKSNEFGFNKTGGGEG